MIRSELQSRLVLSYHRTQVYNLHGISIGIDYYYDNIIIYGIGYSPWARTPAGGLVYRETRLKNDVS